MEDQIKELLSKINDGADWMASELPAVAEEIVQWGLISNAAMVLFSVAIVAACVRMIYLVLTEKPEWAYKNLTYLKIKTLDLDGVMAITVLSALGVGFVGCAIISASQFMMAWCAPRLYTIEQLKGLI